MAGSSEWQECVRLGNYFDVCSPVNARLCLQDCYTDESRAVEEGAVLDNEAIFLFFFSQDLVAQGSVWGKRCVRHAGPREHVNWVGSRSGVFEAGAEACEWVAGVSFSRPRKPQPVKSCRKSLGKDL